VSGPDTVLKVFEWLGYLFLGGLAILLVRALFRPWDEGRSGNRPHDRGNTNPEGPLPPVRHDADTSGGQGGEGEWGQIVIPAALGLLAAAWPAAAWLTPSRPPGYGAGSGEWRGLCCYAAWTIADECPSTLTSGTSLGV
jgi:hypothetical protein